MFDSLNTSYILLSDLCAQMALIVYVFMFAASIKLRYQTSTPQGAYRIPGGKLGVWIVAGLGLLCSLAAILIGFVPPSQVEMQHPHFYLAFLVTGLAVFIIIPLLIARNIKAQP